MYQKFIVFDIKAKNIFIVVSKKLFIAESVTMESANG